MRLDQKLYDTFAQAAKRVTVDIVSIGIGYTAVTTSDGGIGLAYTMMGDKTSCSMVKSDTNFEGRTALALLELIHEKDPILRGMALALVNSLNHKRAMSFPSGKNDASMFDRMEIGAGTKVAMVGFFGPLVPMLEERKAELEVIDQGRGMGEKDRFYDRLGKWADALVLTATSILNSTTEEILAISGNKVRTLILGPSTPMVPQAFDHLPVRVLAGTVPMHRDKVLAAVRHGAGTPVIQRYSKKAFVTAGESTT